MKKLVKILTVINIALIGFLAFLTIGLTFQDGDGWEYFGLFAAAIFFILIAVGLALPLIYIKIKHKEVDIKYYVNTYVIFTTLSVLLFVFSIIMLKVT